MPSSSCSSLSLKVGTLGQRSLNSTRNPLKFHAPARYLPTSSQSGLWPQINLGPLISLGSSKYSESIQNLFKTLQTQFHEVSLTLPFSSCGVRPSCSGVLASQQLILLVPQRCTALGVRYLSRAGPIGYRKTSSPHMICLVHKCC